VARGVCCDWSRRSPLKVIVYRSSSRFIIEASKLTPHFRHRSDAKYGAVTRSSTPSRPGAHRGRLCPSKTTGGACVARGVWYDWSRRSPRKVIVYRSLNRSIIAACSFS
jgi:hypothetical protein